MALELIGSTGFSDQGGSLEGNVTISPPAGWSPGELMIVAGKFRRNSSNPAGDWVTPSGWTKEATITLGGDTADGRISAWTRVLQSGDTSWDFVPTGVYSTSAYVRATYRGVAATPVPQALTRLVESTSDIYPPDMTTAADGAHIFDIVEQSNSTAPTYRSANGVEGASALTDGVSHIIRVGYMPMPTAGFSDGDGTTGTGRRWDDNIGSSVTDTVISLEIAAKPVGGGFGMIPIGG